MFKKRFISVKINILKFIKGEREGIFHVEVCFPKAMPKDEVQDIKRRLNQILDDIKKYL